MNRQTITHIPNNSGKAAAARRAGDLLTTFLSPLNARRGEVDAEPRLGTKRMKTMGAQRKIIIIDDDPKTRSLLSTFLTSMGCECAPAPSGKARDIVKQEAFDAVVLDMRCSEVSADHLISEIEAIGPGAWRRLLVITDEIIGQQTSEMFRLHFLTAHIPRSQVIKQMWPALESIFSLPPSEGEATQGVGLARLAFDSFREPLPAGLRASPVSWRQLLYEHGKVRIDLSIAPLVGLGKIAIVGQVLNAAELESGSKKLPVALFSSSRPVAATTTNRFGEFSFEFDVPEDANVKIRIGEKSWIFAHLEDMAWAIKRLRESAASS